MLDEFLKQQTRLAGVRANMVTDIKGNFIGPNGTSREISNDVDRQLLIRFRQLADLIVTDARTARIESYRRSKHAPLEVWSKSGNFEGLENGQGFTLRKTENLSAALSDHAGKAVLIEAGPTVISLLGQQQLIDELRLTVVGTADTSEARATAFDVTKNLNLEYLDLIEVHLESPCWFFRFNR